MAISGAMAAFFSETDTHLEIIEQSLLQLETKSGDMDLINELFRAVHSLKGNAGLVGLLDIHAIATEMETLLDSVRKEKKSVTQEQQDKFFDSLDKIKGLVEKARGGAPEPKPEPELKSKPKEPPSPKAVERVEHPKPAEHAERDEHPADSSDEHKTASDETHRKAIHGKRSFLTFMLGTEEYGFPITAVREIILKRHVTRVPNSKTFVTGIMNLRGMVIPVINAKKKLGFRTEGDKSENIIIIEDEGMITGVLVDQVKDIVTLEEDMIVTGDKALGNLRSDFIEGIGKVEKHTLMLLDIKHFCGMKEKYF